MNPIFILDIRRASQNNGNRGPKTVRTQNMDVKPLNRYIHRKLFFCWMAVIIVGAKRYLENA